MKEPFDSLETKIDPRHSAVIVADMQNDLLDNSGFLAGVGADVASGQAIIEPLNSFVASARTVGAQVIFLREVFAEATSSANQLAQWGGWDQVIAEAVGDRNSLIRW